MIYNKIRKSFFTILCFCLFVVLFVFGVSVNSFAKINDNNDSNVIVLDNSSTSINTNNDEVRKVKSYDDFLSNVRVLSEDVSVVVNKDDGNVQSDEKGACSFSEYFGDTAEFNKNDLIDSIEDKGYHTVVGETKKELLVSSVFSSKQILVGEILTEAFGAKKAVSYDGRTLLQFDSVEATKTAYEALVTEFGEDKVFLDSLVDVEGSSVGDINPKRVTIGDKKDENKDKPNFNEGKSGSVNFSTFSKVVPSSDSETFPKKLTNGSSAALKDSLIYPSSGAEMTVQESLGLVFNSGLTVYSPKNMEESSFNLASRDMNVSSKFRKNDDLKVLDKEVKVAIIDTGIYDGSIDSSRLVESDSKSFVGDERGDGYNPLKDENGHGTIVASVLASMTPSSVKIVSLRTGDKDGKSTVLSVCEAIRYAREINADVINLSLGSEFNMTDFIGKANVKLYNKELKECYDSGMVVVAAAGNNGLPSVDNSSSCKGSFYPASSPYTISVGSVSDKYVRSDFSNYGKYLDFVAFGEDAYKSYNIPFLKDRQYSGTSVACPAVSAMCALEKQTKKDKTQQQVVDDLSEVSVDLGSNGKDNYYGYGFIRYPLYLRDVKTLNVSVSNAQIASDSKLSNTQLPKVTVKNSGKVVDVVKVSYPDANKVYGDHKINVTGDISKGYTGTKTFNYVVYPKAAPNFSVSANAIKYTLSFSGSSGYYEYQIYNSKNKLINTGKANKTNVEKTVKSLGADQIKVRVRSYVSSKDGLSGKMLYYYSAWSGYKTVKIKKNTNANSGMTTGSSASKSKTKLKSGITGNVESVEKVSNFKSKFKQGNWRYNLNALTIRDITANKKLTVIQKELLIAAKKNCNNYSESGFKRAVKVLDTKLHSKNRLGKYLDNPGKY